MAEALYHKRSETSQYLEDIGYPIPRERIKQVYPTHFPERRVLRLSGLHSGDDLVLKIRPIDNQGKAYEEFDQLQLLFESYRYCGCKFPEVKKAELDSGFVIFEMSYLGPNLGELGTALDLIELNYSPENEVEFDGFTLDQAEELLNKLKKSHLNFAEDKGYIHGDLFQGRHPNNIVYFKPFDHLFFVDAEALGEITDKRTKRFESQFNKVHQWVIENLVV